mmetsp:Transcript_89608/g.155127  ORF Transcript_89608/g.155127 Transcript_89608/m.155127 type:complete len:232 (+) Transcript_89608:3726-4421(+)
MKATCRTPCGPASPMLVLKSELAPPCWHARSLRLSSSASEPTTARRCRNWVRDARALKQMSANGACACTTMPAYLAASPRRDASVYADRHNVYGPPSDAPTPASAPPAGVSTSSRIAWAFVPLNANELRPAVLRPDTGSHGLLTIGITAGISSKGMMSGFSCLKRATGGSVRCRKHRTTLIRPAMPAAPSLCPTLALTAPSTSGFEVSRPSPYTWPAAWTSIGSPSRVPVP